MPQELEALLRKSLDDVDRARKTQIAAGALFLCLFVAMTFWISRTAGTNDVRTVVTDSAKLVAFVVGFCTFAICLFVARMTQKILKAIELLSQK
jgi:hypothetical protein